MRPKLGRFHHRLGVETTWISGTDRLYWVHWRKIIREAIPTADRDSLRDILLRLLVGDLVAQLDGVVRFTVPFFQQASVPRFAQGRHDAS